MKTKSSESNGFVFCDGDKYSRRKFLTNCAKGIGTVSVLSAFAGMVIPESLKAAASAASGAKGAGAAKPAMKVRVVFATIGPVAQEPCWPNIGFDFTPVMEKYMTYLSAGCPRIEFVQSMVDSPKQAEALVAEDNAAGGIDGYLLIHLVSKVHGSVKPLVASGKPVLYADVPYSGTGGFVGDNAAQIRSQAPNYAFMSSRDLGHVVAAANCFLLTRGAGGNKAFADGVAKVRRDAVAKVKPDMTCVEDKFDILSIDELRKELKGKKILTYEKDNWRNIIQPTRDLLGIEIVSRPFSELNDMAAKIDKDKALEVVDMWKNGAEAIVGVRDRTLEKSARLYLAMKQSMEKYGACAITTDCLNGVYSGEIDAYPCLGFHQLINEGTIGACECDTMSTVTMVVMSTLTKGRPGYISDPVLDVANKQICYAHCVATDRPFGPQGAVVPFTIMTHSEDRQGASVRSTLPVGYMTTTLEINPAAKAILLHQAKTVGNSTEDRACRTKLLAVPVGDFEKLFTQWDKWGWHRVTYYGDLKAPVVALADSLGWQVIEEA